MDDLIKQAKACDLCHLELPLGPRPVFQAHPDARILIAGQAPGRRVHESGIPFDDPSGERLRHWLGVSRETFYNPTCLAILPMGFCYPGTGKTGDIPPVKRCATQWRERFLDGLSSVRLTILLGRFAMQWHLRTRFCGSLTETVKHWRSFLPNYVALPHPSPRNNIWLKRNPWFQTDVIPNLQRLVASILDPDGGN